ALKLEGAFSALRRFDFAGAQDAFADLAAGPLELPGRGEAVQTLAEIAHALWQLDARDFAQAAENLAALKLHVPPLAPLRTLIEQGAGHDADALIWLTWGRFDRARSQDRVADALIWAVILHELMVFKLLEAHGAVPGRKGRVRAADLPSGLAEKLRREVPELFQGSELKLMGAKEWLIFLRAPSVMGEAAAPLDVRSNASLERVRTARNQVVHQGVTPELEQLDEAQDLLLTLLRGYPFQAPWASAWAQRPDDAPISAASLTRLTDDLREWVG
ncbi:hypothetical protein SAMN04488058_1478, partial [Deinococcus reticulitermitis]